MNQLGQLPETLQRLLHAIYDVSVGDVGDYLITDPELVQLLERNPLPSDVSEKLLVEQHDDVLDLSLYLDRDLLQRLHLENPLVHLHDANLGDFWLVVEGISHFVYLAWNACHDKPVTKLELELQAEVDKFVTTAYLLRIQGAAGVSQALHDTLFDRVRFRAELDDEHRVRYRHANRYAGKYCISLHQRYLRQVRKPGLVAELRRFYRLAQSPKLRHIESTAVA